MALICELSPVLLATLTGQLLKFRLRFGVSIEIG